MDTLQRARAVIDLRAITHNFSVARHLAPQQKILAVIKADAYGHGAIRVAEALEQANMFGVTDINEAENLRNAGCDKPILLMQGLITPNDISRLVSGNFSTVIHRNEDLHWLESLMPALTPDNPLQCWLKLQSGMGRLGLSKTELLEAYHFLCNKPWAAKPIVMTHFGNASQPMSPLNNQQEKKLMSSLAALPPDTSYSVTASSSMHWLHLSTPSARQHWSRPGLLLYGSSPFDQELKDKSAKALGLMPAMTLEARLLCINEHQAGDHIGYNSQFICPKKMRSGIVSIGYADGYPSHMPNFAPVLVDGMISRSLGRVSMDMMAIDLSELPDVFPGAVVTLWGKGLDIDQVAAHAGVISYDLLCSVTQRVPRQYHN
jgi:alanine racemase